MSSTGERQYQNHAIKWLEKRAGYWALCFLVACSPQIVENVRTEYVYRDRIQVDTTVVKDSIFIEKYIKNDTVRFVEFRDHLIYQYKYMDRTDTLIIRDSVQVKTVRQVPVELNPWQRFRIGAFWWLLAIAAIAICYVFRIPLLKLIRFQ